MDGFTEIEEPVFNLNVGYVALATSRIVSEYIKAASPLVTGQMTLEHLQDITVKVRKCLVHEPEEVAVVDEVEPELVPPVDPSETVFRTHIISLEDGKPYTGLKKHLGSLGMTPDDYRAKWKLPADYPMVCEEYSERRSQIAKEMGLGKK